MKISKGAFTPSCMRPGAREGIALACFALYAAWACLLPISQAPDEATRLAVPFWIAQNGTLPNGFEPSIRNTLWGISYAFTPYGSSLLSAVFVRAASSLSLGTCAQVAAARLSSCISGSLTVYVVMVICSELGYRRSTMLVSGIGLGLLPQFAFLSSYLNNDIFSAFCSSLVILSWVRGLKNSWRQGDCVLLGASLGLLSLSYYFAYAFIPVSVLVYFGSSFGGGNSKTVFKNALLISVVALLIGGWFFLWNALSYSGDFLGMKAYSESADLFAAHGFKPSDHWTPKLAGQRFMSPLFDHNWIKFTVESSICILGYMAYALPNWLYKITLATYATVIGTFLVPRKRSSLPSDETSNNDWKKARRKKALFICGLIACGAAPILFSAYRSWSTDYQGQGRYVIATWIVVAVFFSAGLDRLTNLKLKEIKLVRFAPRLLVVFSLVLATVAFSTYSTAGFGGIAQSLTFADGPELMATQDW